jgi:hypothetical protein
MYAGVLYVHTYIIHLSVYVRIGRGYVCVHECDRDGSVVCARVGGLVLRARPEPDTLNRASPCLSASTACGFGAQAFNFAKTFNANIGAWNTASVTSLFQVCAAPGPAARTMADALGRASMRRGPLCVRASVCNTLTHTLSIYLYMRESVGVMYACTSATGIDRLCAHALAGSCCGLGLNPTP